MGLVGVNCIGVQSILVGWAVKPRIGLLTSEIEHRKALKLVNIDKVVVYSF